MIAACSPEVTTGTTDTPAAAAETASLQSRIDRLEDQLGDLHTQVNDLKASRGAALIERNEVLAREAELRAILTDNVSEFEIERARYQLEISQLRQLASLPDTPDVRQAITTLEEFVAAMREGRFAQAADLYAGTYQTVIEWNPQVDSAAHPALLEAACRHQLQCGLRIRRILPGLIDGNQYNFHVEFETEDGALFTRGPCCGDDSGNPPETQFPFQIVTTGARYQVTTLPVYVP